MRAVIQRVSEASVSVGGKEAGRIGRGFLVLLAVHADDTEDKVARMADKVAKLRIFEDADGKMNISLKEAGGAALVVSQFTLYGDPSAGNRPSFISAARPEKAVPFYERFVAELRERGIAAGTGRFGAHMRVALVNDGPVTIIIDI